MRTLIKLLAAAGLVSTVGACYVGTPAPHYYAYGGCRYWDGYRCHDYDGHYYRRGYYYRPYYY